MREVQQILGQVPPEIRERGSVRERAEEIWRIAGRHRNGQQTRIAADLAERWEAYNRSPKLPVDDPRTAAKRLAKALSGETAFDVDLYFEFCRVLPEAYRMALEIITGSRGNGAEPGEITMLGPDDELDLPGAVRENRRVDNMNDGLVTDLLVRGIGNYTTDELRELDRRLENEDATIDQLRAAIRNTINDRGRS